MLYYSTENWENSYDEPNWVLAKSIHDITNFDYLSKTRRCMSKYSCGNNIIHRLLKASDAIHRGKIEQILLAYALPKETVAAIMKLYKNTKVKVHSPDGDANYFDIVAGELQEDTLTSYLFIIFLYYVRRTSIDLMKGNGFKLAKESNRRCFSQSITDEDYADDIAFLGNTPTVAKSMLRSLEWAAGDIGLHVNADKTEYICFN